MEQERHNVDTEEIENMIKSGHTGDFLDLLRDSEDSESVHLHMKKILNEKDMTAADVVKVCDSERSYVYQMLNGKRKPTRRFLICFGLITGLSATELQRLLKLADKSPLYVRKRFDAVIFYALEHGMDIDETNELLFELGEDAL